MSAIRRGNRPGGTIWGGAFPANRGFHHLSSPANKTLPIQGSPIQPAPVSSPVPNTATAALPPAVVPAVPIPFIPAAVQDYPRQENPDGTITVIVNSSKITIPDLDILAVIQ